MTTPCRQPASGKANQQGVALIVTVLLMMVISLLALTAMRRSNLDERMAFNQRDRQVALQAAEAALRDGEDMIELEFGEELNEAFFLGKDDCANSNGWCYPQSDQKGWSSLDWKNSNSATTFTLSQRKAMTGVSSQPRYLIEYLGSESLGAGNPCVARFSITARAVGLNTNSTVTLRSLYRRRIGVCLPAVL